MSISAELREQVRQRANFACEYCGVTEIDAGGELTIDHYHPQSRGGADSLENLIYCCLRCNQHKARYLAASPDVSMLWNPREESSSNHFLELADGTLYSTTPKETFTLNRLRLNRPALVAHRLRRRQPLKEIQLMERYERILAALEQLSEQHATLLEEHRDLLKEQKRMILLFDTD